MKWHLHNGATAGQLGFIPQFLSDFDPRPAAEQFIDAYAHGGGWHSFGKGQWKLQLPILPESASEYALARLIYPGDPAYKCVAHAVLHFGTDKAELVLVFPFGPWVVVKKFTSDDFDVARMD